MQLFLKCLFTLFCSVSLCFAKSENNRQEVQHHGYIFEKWIRESFFDGYSTTNYTQKWDIPKEANKRYGNVPVNPKATKYGTPVGLGDALRQFQINDPFMLIIGYWIQEGDEKRFVNIVAPIIQPEAYRKLWDPIKWEDLEKLDKLVKDKSIDYKEVRKRAQEIKDAPPFTEAIIEVNPKIDSKGQRRLQCSLRFEDVFKYLAPDWNSTMTNEVELFGVKAPGPFKSSPRTFREEEDEKTE